MKPAILYHTDQATETRHEILQVAVDIASAEFDSRPGVVRDQIAGLTKAWMAGLQEEIAFAQSKKEVPTSLKPAQLAFELHAYVQEANWAFKLFNDKSAFLLARRAIADRIAIASGERVLAKSKR